MKVAAEKVFATTHTESSSSKSAGAKFSKNYCRTARARVTALEAAIRALGSVYEVALSFTEGRTVCPCFSNWGAFGCAHRARKRFAKAETKLLKLQTERAQLATELPEGQARFEAFRAEAGPKPPSRRAAPKDLGSESDRMQGVIDDLLPDTSTRQKAKDLV